MAKTEGTITITMDSEGGFSTAMKNVNDKDVVFGLSFALKLALDRIAAGEKKGK